MYILMWICNLFIFYCYKVFFFSYIQIEKQKLATKRTKNEKLSRSN